MKLMMRRNGSGAKTADRAVYLTVILTTWSFW